MLFVLAIPARGAAYCRATTESEAPTCPSQCETTGIPLFWGERTISYAFHESGIPGLSDADMREAIRLSFAQWEQVLCNDRATGFAFHAKPSPTSRTVGPQETQPDENVLIYYGPEEWKQRGLSEHVYALTAVWFDKDNGEILDADMQFNGGMGPFRVCPDTGCRPGEIDLRNVATHEIGHFVGLAHSDDPGSTMYCSALPSDLNKRALSPDDERGLCAAYPAPLPTTDDASHDREEQGCGAAPTRGRFRTLPLSIGLALTLLAVRRRRTVS